MKISFTTIFVFLAFVSFSQIPDGYYDTAEDLNGEELKTALYNIIKGHTDFPYTDATTDTWDILKESDRDTVNSDNVLLIYTGESVNAAQEYNSGSGWSREHVWAKSHGFPEDSQDAYRDVHHLRPCDISVNSARGNKDFDNGGTQHSEATECYTDTDSWEPRPVEKGDVARMMFYMATRYEGESGDPDLELVDYTGTDGPIFGKLSTLIQWSEEDPVDNFERNRNEVVYSYQGNRNPFIDHPEFVNAIYNPDEDTTSTGTYMLAEEQQIKIYPNPAANYINIDAPDNYSFEIYSVIGAKMIDTKNKHIDISYLDSGIYFVLIKNEKGKSIKGHKIIKK